MSVGPEKDICEPSSEDYIIRAVDSIDTRDDNDTELARSNWSRCFLEKTKIEVPEEMKNYSSGQLFKHMDKIAHESIGKIIRVKIGWTRSFIQGSAKTFYSLVFPPFPTEL